jgi:DHA1 family bicyclomycin/chloramphenicol resistance-like MFS transporter
VNDSGAAETVSGHASLSLRGWLVWLTAISCLPPLGLNLAIPLDRAMGVALALPMAESMGAIGLYALGLAIGQPLAGIAADKWGRRPTLLAGLAIGAFGGSLSSLASDGASLLAGRAICGLGLSVALVVPRAVLRDLASDRALQRGMAIISAAFAFTPAIAPVLGWWLLGRVDWRGVLALLPCLTLVAVMGGLLVQVETRPPGTVAPSLEGLSALWKHRASRWTALSFAAIGSLFFVMIAVVPAALRDTVGADDRGVALLLGGTYLGFLCGNIMVAVAAGRARAFSLCFLGATIAAIGVMLMTLCALHPSVALWTVGLLAYSLGHGLIFPAAIGRIMQAMAARAGMAAAMTGMMPMLAGAALCAIAACGHAADDPVRSCRVVRRLAGAITGRRQRYRRRRANGRWHMRRGNNPFDGFARGTNNEALDGPGPARPAHCRRLPADRHHRGDLLRRRWTSALQPSIRGNRRAVIGGAGATHLPAGALCDP